MGVNKGPRQDHRPVDSLITSPVTIPAVLSSAVEIRVVTSEERVALVSLWRAKKIRVGQLCVWYGGSLGLLTPRIRSKMPRGVAGLASLPK